jgi:hypothetical protein
MTRSTRPSLGRGTHARLAGKTSQYPHPLVQKARELARLCSVRVRSYLVRFSYLRIGSKCYSWKAKPPMYGYLSPDI